eukprot:comp192209_c0_seq1/m.49691 comp192209_c0_seq1/g.49691  ORF comp192209_c0_seq1/g.49691 comp192209_c0_seq1/m.49691 type:complete len:155 (-) comp192209_c0_seq1:227-691(-)
MPSPRKKHCSLHNGNGWVGELLHRDLQPSEMNVSLKAAQAEKLRLAISKLVSAEKIPLVAATELFDRFVQGRTQKEKLIGALKKMLPTRTPRGDVLLSLMRVLGTLKDEEWASGLAKRVISEYTTVQMTVPEETVIEVSKENSTQFWWLQYELC